MANDTRQIKIHEVIIPQKQKPAKRIPKIQLQGSWLHDAGFSIGDFVKIAITGNSIHITNTTR